MTRINPIVFALLLGLVGAGLFFAFVYVDGTGRLSQIAIPTALIIAVGWFMSQRVATKSRQEQSKQRWLAILAMLLITGAYLFADYKKFESNFVDTCDKSASIFVCECLEEQIGVKLWAQQLPERPQVALGKESMGALMRRINIANRDQVQAAMRSCARR